MRWRFCALLVSFHLQFFGESLVNASSAVENTFIFPKLSNVENLIALVTDETALVIGLAHRFYFIV